MSIIDDLVQVAERAQRAPKLLHVARAVEEGAETSDWISVEDRLPSRENVLDVRVLLTDGSEVNCWAQSDGDFYWKGGGTEMFILDYKVTHWKPLQK